MAQIPEHSTRRLPGPTIYQNPPLTRSISHHPRVFRLSLHLFPTVSSTLIYGSLILTCWIDSQAIALKNNIRMSTLIYWPTQRLCHIVDIISASAEGDAWSCIAYTYYHNVMMSGIRLRCSPFVCPLLEYAHPFGSTTPIKYKLSYSCSTLLQ